MLLKDYIRGDKRGKEANRLEREAMNDPFLQGALEGFEKVAGDHAGIIEALEKKYARPAGVPQKNRKLYVYWSAAASILLLIGFGIYFMMNKSTKKENLMLAEVQSKEDVSVKPVDDFSALLQAETEKSQNERIFEKESIKKEITKSTSPPVIIVADEKSPADRIVTDAETDYLADLSETAIEIEEIIQPLSSKVTLVEEKIDLPLFPEATLVEQIIRGKIVDETGEPIVGASVVEKGSTTGVITDTNGVFSLPFSIDSSSQLVASYLGYESKEITPSDKYQIVTLKPNYSSLSEVVVIGYGTQKRSATTGAVATINKSDSSAFGEKEFQAYCQQNADKNICASINVSVNVSFFIDETGKPTNIKYKKYS
jgi:hypothetical protein